MEAEQGSDTSRKSSTNSILRISIAEQRPNNAGPCRRSFPSLASSLCLLLCCPFVCSLLDKCHMRQVQGISQQKGYSLSKAGYRAHRLKVIVVGLTWLSWQLKNIAGLCNESALLFGKLKNIAGLYIWYRGARLFGWFDWFGWRRFGWYNVANDRHDKRKYWGMACLQIYILNVEMCRWAELLILQARSMQLEIL